MRAVRLAGESGLEAASAELGISPRSLYRWLAAHQTGEDRGFNSVDADVVAQVVRTWLDDSLEGWPEGSDRHARVT
jgi:transposase-like protein